MPNKKDMVTMFKRANGSKRSIDMGMLPLRNDLKDLVISVRCMVAFFENDEVIREALRRDLLQYEDLLLRS